MKKLRFTSLFFAFLCADLLLSCNATIVNDTRQEGHIGSIDIPSPGFFFMLRPWEKGKLVTMDGKARFAELSFVGKSSIRITPLIDFPEQRIDRRLITEPEAHLCITQSGARFHIADIANKKIKSFAPFVNWRFSEGGVMLLNPENRIIYFYYF